MADGNPPVRAVRTAAEMDDNSRYVQASFYALANHGTSRLTGDEVLVCHLAAEDSDFVRINAGRIRQAGNVRQRVVTVRLVDGKRHAAAELSLTGVQAADQRRIDEVIDDLRALLPNLPEDPHLLYEQTSRTAELHGEAKLPDARDAVDAALGQAEGLDLVGIYAGGGIYEGFASSLGQRNWYSSFSFNLDFSCYHHADKAVKSGYAGFEWDNRRFADKIESARRELAILARPGRTVEPGRYRVYLSPAAVRELLSLLSWGSFGLKSQRTRQSPLQRLVDGDRALHDGFTLHENTRGGIAAGFDSWGFAKSPTVPLIAGGRHAGSLVSPRSAAEFGQATNGANEEEMPQSLDLAAGMLADDEVLGALGTGVYVNNLWYTNYSDRSSGRITGMTRFATFWVQDGEIVAPLNVMRFDETVYRMFGANLVGLTAGREMMLDADTYFRRSTASVHAPGALVDDFTFTL